MKTRIIQLFTLLLAILFIVACKKEETDTAPTIPPYETMVVNFSNFANQNKSVATQAEILSNVNLAYSAVSVGVWNVLIGSTFAVPLAAFKTAFTQNPVKIADGTWQWTYTVDGFTNQYTARLVSEVQTSQIKWKMYITKTGTDPFDEFLWFEGTSDPDGNSGQWILYHSSLYPEKTVQIDWEKTVSAVDKIKYTYVGVKDELGNSLDDPGSYLIYGSQEGIFDAYITSHHYSQQEEAFIDVFIEWSSTDNSGHVKAEYFFGDTDWHCWDSAGNDVDCS